MTDQQQPTEPLRRPLRVPVAGMAQGPDGRSVYTSGWRIVRPGDWDYEAEDAKAVARSRALGAQMPYAGEPEEETHG